MIKREQKDLASRLQNLGGKHQNRIIELDMHQDENDALKKLKALASKPRLRILRYLTSPIKLCNLSEIAEALEMNLATVTMHINILEEAGLLLCEHIPGERGTQRVCGCFTNWLNMHFNPKKEVEVGRWLEHHIPLGSYTNFLVTPTCGLFSEDKHIGQYDDPSCFYEIERVKAQLLWFHSGFVEYKFAHNLPPRVQIEQLNLSMEICSEAPTYHEAWLSDITVWLNGIDIGSWTSPADFGGTRGILTPAWQPTHATQYGLLKTWQVNAKNSQVDGHKVSDTSLKDLRLLEKPYLSLRIGVKEDAPHVGGINIFGAKFGNHPQDIILRIRYH
ncbi:MAG: helix-turn-helix domain-containing protein [Deinococcales bacterium]